MPATTTTSRVDQVTLTLPAAPTLADVLLPTLEQRLQPTAYSTSGVDLTASTGSRATVVVANLLQNNDSATASSPSSATPPGQLTLSPPHIERLVAGSATDFDGVVDFREVSPSFGAFDEVDEDLFGSPLPFDASENGLWNGRFVPPPPRPPFFVDEPVLSDGLTTCDLCSWAMPAQSTFTFDATMEKASEFGWPLTLTIVSILSALLGAIIMITVVKCKRRKSSHQRSDTHVQWWSRHKRSNGNNNHLRRSNIYTAHPADSIRGLHQNSPSAASSLTAMTTAIQAVATAPPAPLLITPSVLEQQQQQQQQQPQLQLFHHPHIQPAQHQLPQSQQAEHEHEYHQPLELQLQHERQHSSSVSTSASASASLSGSSATPSPPLQTRATVLAMQMPHPQPHPHPGSQGAQPLHGHQQQQQQQRQDLHDNLFHWPTATTLVTS